MYSWDHSKLKDYNDTYPSVPVYQTNTDAANLHEDDFEIDHADFERVVIKMQGFLTPPHTGNFKLMIKADDLGKFFLNKYGNSTKELVSPQKLRIHLICR